MKTEAYVSKGDRVRVSLLRAKPFGTYSLAGAQPKITAEAREFTGTVKSVRGDHPTNPTAIMLLVTPDDGGPDEFVPPSAVKEKLS